MLVPQRLCRSCSWSGERNVGAGERAVMDEGASPYLHMWERVRGVSQDDKGLKGESTR